MAQLTDEEILKQQYEKFKKKQDTPEGGFEYGREDKFPIPFNEYSVLRFAGMPKEVFYSFIIADDSKYRVIKFPSDDDTNFILYRIAKRVLDRTYLGKDDKGDAMFDYHVKNSHPEIFKMIFNNGQDKIGPYGANGWTKPTGKVTRAMVANVINRKAFSTTMKDKDDNDVIRSYSADWCKENNHTLLLTGDMKAFSAAVTVYDKLMGEIYPIKGSFLKYDIAIQRHKVDPWYTLASGKDVMDGSKNGAPEMQKIAQYIKEGEFPEEQQYVRYDLDALTKPTSYKEIHDWLKIKIGAIDAALKTTFLDELETLVREEGGQVAPKGVHSGVNTKQESSSPYSEEPEEPEEVVPETPVTPVRATRKPATTGGVDMDAVKKIAPFVEGLTDEEKAEITGVNGDKVTFKESEELWLDCPNPSCGRASTTKISTQCIYCGTKF